MLFSQLCIVNNQYQIIQFIMDGQFTSFYFRLYIISFINLQMYNIKDRLGHQSKNITLNNYSPRQKPTSPPISPKINNFQELKLSNIDNPLHNLNSKYAPPPLSNIQQQNFMENFTTRNIRTPTEKYNSFKINLPKTPNQNSEQKYFKSNNFPICIPFDQDKKKQLTHALFKQHEQDAIQQQRTIPKKQFRNSGQSQRTTPFYESQKTDRMPRPSDHFQQQFSNSSKKQPKNYKIQQMISQHKKKTQLFKKALNLKETSSTLSTIHATNKKSQENLMKNFKYKEQIFHNNKLSKSDFIELKYMGQGKFGDVHVVKHKITGFIAALKTIKKKQIIQENLVGQLIRQLKIQSFLNHPNIINFYGSFEDKDNIYILLELGSQGQLYTKLKKKQKYSQQAAAFVIKSLLSAVQYMHSKKLLHRDIKPQNIVIVHGIVKLCDFGWAVYRGNELRATFCGTPLYVSPQLLKGNSYDQKTDLWAIGILAYQLVIGNIPFQINHEQQLKKIITDDIIFPKNLDLSEEYKDFILKILKKNPKERLSSEDLLKHQFILRYNDFQTCEQLCGS